MDERIKVHLIELSKNGDGWCAYLPKHVGLVEKWAKKIFEKIGKGDWRIISAGVWLHDSGIATEGIETDHAISSEKEARKFLAEIGWNNEDIEKVAHIVRAHRCKDILPETIEAKIVATADSASHMTDIVYIDMANEGRLEEAKEKLERDNRDKGLIPEIESELSPLYEGWKKILENYPI